MINIDNVEKFVTDELAHGEHFSLRKEGWIELITRLRQAEKDAARYRWLRDSGSDYSVCSVLSKQESECDSAIDEAMQCK